MNNSTENNQNNNDLPVNNNAENVQDNNDLPVNNNAENVQDNNDLPVNNNAENVQGNDVWRIQDGNYIQLDPSIPTTLLNYGLGTNLQQTPFQRQEMNRRLLQRGWGGLLQRQWDASLINPDRIWEQDLNSTNIRSFIGTNVQFWWPELDPIANRAASSNYLPIGQFPENLLPNRDLITNISLIRDRWIDVIERDDTLYDNYYPVLEARYRGQDCFIFQADFGQNSLVDNLSHINNTYSFTIYDFPINYGALQHLIILLEFEIHQMEQARIRLMNGNLNADIFTYDGEFAENWNIHDYRQLLAMNPDLELQINRKIIVLRFLRNLLLLMQLRDRM